MANENLASEAARIMGSAKTEKKRAASLISLAEARASRWTEERKAEHAAAMRRAWKRRKAEKSKTENSP